VSIDKGKNWNQH